MRFARAACCFAALVLAGCAASSRIEREKPAELTKFKSEVEVRELWTANVGSLAGTYEARLLPVLQDNVLYVANSNGRVVALAADSGKQRWRIDLDAPVTGATGVGSGLVVVGTRKGEVIALDAATGARRWNGRVSSEVQAAPAVGPDVVVVQTVDGRVSGLSATDGKRLWAVDRSEPALSLHGTSAPVIAGEFVLTGFANGKVVALQLKDGKILWEEAVAQPHGRNEIERLVDVDAPPLLWGERLFAVAYQGRVIAIDMRSGRLVWTRDVSSYVGMDADRAAVFVADQNGQVVALDQSGGASLWRQDKLHGRALSGPSLHGDAVVVGDFEGYLHWLARDDGHLVGRYRLSSAAVNVRGIVDGATLYAVAQDGHLAALQLGASK